jgi:hypothetical protein
MTKIIRNRSGHYLKADGTWTTIFEEAEMFPSTLELIHAWQSFQLLEVEMVLVVGDKPCSEWDVVLPLEKSFKSSSLEL